VGILQRILEAKRREIARLELPRIEGTPQRRELALRQPGRLALIAEIKRRSPSAGQLSTQLSVAARARTYERAGAAMVSVLCDREFFDGAHSHLREARDACSLPLLCKDFIIDERQLRVARAWGADAALLIVRCLTGSQTSELVDQARACGLVPVVEVTTEEEAQVALDAGAEVIGVNTRNLDTLEMDAVRAHRVLESLPDTISRIHFSGLKSEEDVRGVALTSADAALIGEALMRQDDPTRLLSAMVAASRRRNAPFDDEAR